MATAKATCARSAFAEESGRIAVLVQREIQTGTLWPLKRIPETTYDASKGENPRSIRMQFSPPNRVEYQPILNPGNEARNWPDGLGGDAIAGFGDKQGRGCSIPAERLQWGYDEFGRCVRATALETDPMCLITMMEKHAVGATISALRASMPRFAKEHFANELLRRVIQFSKHLWSVAPGNPYSTSTGKFPAVPTGGLNIGVLRNVENFIRREGWDDGSQTPMVNGRPAFQIYAGRDSIEFAITQRKIQKKLHLDSTFTADDKTFGQTEVYEGIQFIENPLPPRGYLRQTTSGNYEFVEISPWTNRAGVEGVVNDVSPEYNASFVNLGGANYLVLEVGFAIHPRAMERQAMGSMPTVDGKKVAGKFNFEVNMVPDWAILADSRCNKDGFYVQWRMLHAYAPFPFNPELMTAFLYIAATPQTIIVSPTSDYVAPTTAPISMAPFGAPSLDGCLPCAEETVTRDPTSPTCTDVFPSNGVGVMRWRQLNYDVSEDAVGLTVVAERAGGSTGAATVAYATASGTATSGTEFTSTSGTFSWADGEFGKKSVVVPINSTGGDDAGKTFTVVLSSATGATLGTPSTTTVTILDPDNA